MLTSRCESTLNPSKSFFNFRLTPFLIIALLFGASLATRISKIINHDTAWYLYSAAEFIKGGKLYENIFWEVNPPLNLYLTIPPVYFAQVTGLSSVDVFIVYVISLTTISLSLIWHLLSCIPDLSNFKRYSLLICAFFALFVCCPGGEFGQREHLMIVLSLPYVFLLILRLSGGQLPWPFPIVIGLLGAIGFALKPHFLLVPTTIEIYRLIKTRSLGDTFRSETMVLGVIIGAYVLSIWFFTPEYITRVVPFAQVVYDAGYQISPIAVLFRSETIFLSIIFLLHFTNKSRNRYRIFSEVFLICSLCFFLIYLIQMKGFSYHIYPVTSMLVLTLGSIVLGKLPHPFPSSLPQHHSLRPLLSVLALIVVFVGLLGVPLYRGDYHNADLELLMPVVKKHAPDSSIYIFSSTVSAGFPLVNYAGVKWSSRFASLWLLPGFERLRQDFTSDGLVQQRERLDEIKRFSINAIIKDLSTQWPSLIIVDTKQRKRAFGDIQFDFLNFFSSDSRFTAIWSHYNQIADLGDFKVFLRQSPKIFQKPMLKDFSLQRH